MLLKRLFLLTVLLLFPVTSTRAGDLENLETVFENVLERLNSRDLEGFLKSWHPEAVLFVADYLWAVDRADVGQEIWSRIFDEFFATTKSATYTALDVHFRIIGDTGLVWGLTELIVKPKEEARQVRNLRLTVVFQKADGRWRIVSWHSSRLPERIKPRSEG